MALIGSILGQAVGDALGFVVEGYSSDVCESYNKMIIEKKANPIMTRLSQFTFGQYSDDTQLAREFLISVYQKEGMIDPAVYALRIAMLFQPGAYTIVGYGHQTERGALAIRDGESYKRSGCTRGNGNGSAMRSAQIGIVYNMLQASSKPLYEVVKELSAITHASPNTIDGAVVIAYAGLYAAQSSGHSWDNANFVRYLHEIPMPIHWVEKTTKLVSASYHDALAIVKETAMAYGEKVHANAIGHGVIQTVLWAVYCASQYPDDFCKAIGCAIQAGGDVDTTAAIVGAIVGARVGKDAIPANWISAIHDTNTVWTASKLESLCEKITLSFK